MGVQRKCYTCGTWNGDEDICKECGTILSPVIIEENREKDREKRRFTPPSKMMIFLDKWENSRYFLLRIIYKILYSIAILFFAIASFFAWLAATPNG